MGFSNSSGFRKKKNYVTRVKGTRISPRSITICIAAWGEGGSLRGDVRYALYDALREALAEALADRPQVVALDDVHEAAPQEVDLIDRVEGLQSDVIVQTTLPWWGGGIHSDVALDLSAWSTLHVSLKSDVVADFDIGMTGGVEGRASVADYGYAPDGAWHDLVIPLSDLTAQGVDLSAVTVALLLVAEGGAAGDRVHVDDLYLGKD